MEYIELPGVDCSVSRIGLGTWSMGGWLWGGSDERACIRTIHAAMDQGINLIDTAPVYGFGVAEEIVGRALQETGRRHEVVIATKVGLAWRGEEVHRDASRERIMKEIDDSLRRLRTDTIDIYQVHWPDPWVQAEETAGTMRELVQAGKIRAIGVSNYSPHQMHAFAAGAPLHVSQPPYNLFERGIEEDVLPHCREQGIVTLVYGALCRGLLSGRMTPNTTFEGDDLRKLDPKFRPRRYEQYLAAVHDLDVLARSRYDKSVLSLAVRWILDQPGVGVALWGARRPEQLDAVSAVLGWSLDEGALGTIDQIVQNRVRSPVGPEFMAPPPREKPTSGLAESRVRPTPDPK